MEDDAATANRAYVTRATDALAAAGVDNADIPGRVELLTKVAGAFEQTTGHPPSWAWWVPGRIEIFGKHTDYAGGRSLVAAVPRGFVIAAGPRSDHTVAAHDARWSSSMTLDLDDPNEAFHGWANYIAVVARRFANNFPGAPLGADLTFASDLPRAAGLSSSSALVVGVALALGRIAGLAQRPEWQAAICDGLDLAGYLGAVENGLAFRSLDGTSGVGTHGGSEDHTAILNSRAGHVGAFSYVPTQPEGTAAMPPDWRFIVMTSGIEAAKAGAAKASYNRASLATQALLDLWRRHTRDDTARTLSQVLARGAGAEATLREAVARQRHADFTAEALDKRLSHFIAEDGRVIPALEAFRAANAPALGALADATQADAERLLGNQVPETIALASIAREAGAFGASSFGAGFGGSVWGLADASQAAGVCERWRAAYVQRFPKLQNVAGTVVWPGVAATQIW